MGVIIKYFLELHKWNKFLSLLILVALILPSLCIIVFYYYEEFLKYNVINIIILSIIINIFCLICIYSISNIVRKIINLIFKEDYNAIKLEFDQLENAPIELKNHSKIYIFERDIIYTSSVYVAIVFIQILVFTNEKLYSYKEIVPAILTASGLLTFLLDQMTLGAIGLGLLSFLYEKSMYSKMKKEIKKEQNKNIDKESKTA